MQAETSPVCLFGHERGICGGALSASVFGKLEAFTESDKVAVEICSWRQAKVLLLI